MASPVETYLALYAHVARLTLRGVTRKAPYLLVAPLVAGGLEYVSELLTAFIRGGTESLVVSLLHGFIRAAAISLVLFVGRAIIEQRTLDADSISVGLGAFFNDVLTVLFVFFIVSYAGGGVGSAFVIGSVTLLPLMETVALSHVSGLAIFESAFKFVRRDLFPWLAGQIPILVLLLVWSLWAVFVRPFLTQLVVSTLSGVVGWALVLVAYIYRGVLFLTLDGTSPRRRAERFGGEQGLG